MPGSFIITSVCDYCACVCVSHFLADWTTAGYPMAQAQQDLVDVDVDLRASVTQVELQNISAVTGQSSHQRIIAAQLLKWSSGLKSPASLQTGQDIQTKNYSEMGETVMVACWIYSPWKV